MARLANRRGRKKKVSFLAMRRKERSSGVESEERDEIDASREVIGDDDPVVDDVRPPLTTPLMGYVMSTQNATVAPSVRVNGKISRVPKRRTRRSLPSRIEPSFSPIIEETPSQLKALRSMGSESVAKQRSQSDSDFESFSSESASSTRARLDPNPAILDPNPIDPPQGVEAAELTAPKAEPFRPRGFQRTRKEFIERENNTTRSNRTLWRPSQRVTARLFGGRAKFSEGGDSLVRSQTTARRRYTKLNAKRIRLHWPRKQEDRQHSSSRLRTRELEAASLLSRQVPSDEALEPPFQAQATKKNAGTFAESPIQGNNNVGQLNRDAFTKVKPRSAKSKAGESRHKVRLMFMSKRRRSRSAVLELSGKQNKRTEIEKPEAVETQQAKNDDGDDTKRRASFLRLRKLGRRMASPTQHKKQQEPVERPDAGVRFARRKRRIGERLAALRRKSALAMRLRGGDNVVKHKIVRNDDADSQASSAVKKSRNILRRFKKKKRRKSAATEEIVQGRTRVRVHHGFGNGSTRLRPDMSSLGTKSSSDSGNDAAKSSADEKSEPSLLEAATAHRDKREKIAQRKLSFFSLFRRLRRQNTVPNPMDADGIFACGRADTVEERQPTSCKDVDQETSARVAPPEKMPRREGLADKIENLIDNSCSWHAWKAGNKQADVTKLRRRRRNSSMPPSVAQQEPEVAEAGFEAQLKAPSPRFNRYAFRRRTATSPVVDISATAADRGSLSLQKITTVYPEKGVGSNASETRSSMLDEQRDTPTESFFDRDDPLKVVAKKEGRRASRLERIKKHKVVGLQQVKGAVKSSLSHPKAACKHLAHKVLTGHLWALVKMHMVIDKKMRTRGGDSNHNRKQQSLQNDIRSAMVPILSRLWLFRENRVSDVTTLFRQTPHDSPDQGSDSEEAELFALLQKEMLAARVLKPQDFVGASFSGLEAGGGRKAKKVAFADEVAGQPNGIQGKQGANEQDVLNMEVFSFDDQSDVSDLTSCESARVDPASVSWWNSVWELPSKPPNEEVYDFQAEHERPNEVLFEPTSDQTGLNRESGEDLKRNVDEEGVSLATQESFEVAMKILQRHAARVGLSERELIAALEAECRPERESRSGTRTRSGSRSGTRSRYGVLDDIGRATNELFDRLEGVYEPRKKR